MLNDVFRYIGYFPERRAQNIDVSAFLRDGDGASIRAAGLPAEARLN